MTDQQIVLALNVVLWGFFCMRLVTALRQGRLRRAQSLRGWAIIVSCYLVAALTIEPLAAQVDALFGGQPVAMLLRTLTVLLTAHFFFAGLNWIDLPGTTRADTLFRLGNPLAIALCVAVYAAGTSTTLLTIEQTDHLVKAVRDVAMCLWIPLVFYPRIVELLRREQNRAMQAHRVLNIGFLASAWVQFAAGVGLSAASLANHSSAGLFFEIDRWSKYVVLLFILAQLFPAHWLMPLFFPVRAFILLRLINLERHMRPRSFTKRFELNRDARVWEEDELDLMIYSKLIAILDMCELLDESGARLRQEIAALVAENPPADVIARRLARIRL